MSSQHIMVVEDEESFVEALQIGLAREGFTVSVARDGAEAPLLAAGAERLPTGSLRCAAGVQVSALPRGAQIEIDGVMEVPSTH